MIPRSTGFAILALFCAIGVHAAALVRPEAKDEVLIEGGGSVAPAAVGSSFADLVEGVQSPAPINDVTDARKPSEPEEPQDISPPTPVKPVELTQASAPAAPMVPSVQSPAEPREASPATAEPTPVQVKPIAVSVPVLPHVAEDVDATETAAPVQARPVEAAQVRAQAEPTVVQPVTEVSELAPTQVERPKERPSKTQRPKPTPPTPPKPPVASTSTQRGNSAINARAGAETGQAEQKATQAGSETKGKSESAGNAATSNYKGLVQRKIWRTRVTRVSVSGTAYVKLQVGPGGGLVNVQIVRSSGNAKLDRVALQQVKKAAPFPPTPNGARLTFTMGIKGS